MGKRFFRVQVLIEDEKVRPAADWGQGLQAFPVSPFVCGMSANGTRTEMLVRFSAEDLRPAPPGWVELSESEYAVAFEGNEGRPPEEWER